MDKAYQYREKNVRDLPVGDSMVRVWDASGSPDRATIAEYFEPLFRTGLVFPYAALMPDYHPGENSMIGSVIPTRGVILPSVVGGDLGCGVMAVQLPVMADSLGGVLGAIRDDLRANIPTGSSHNSQVTDRVAGNPVWQREMKAPLLTARLRNKLQRQFASLGGGNHFLEIQRDSDGLAWLMLHSGSRYLGIVVRDHYLAQGAVQACVDQRVYRQVPCIAEDCDLGTSYLSDVQYAVDFARASRREMMLRALEVLACHCGVLARAGADTLMASAQDVAHNYVTRERHFGLDLLVHRKGAIRLGEGEIGFVPGSMGSTSFAVEGRGNRHAFSSCSHGAGRAMSRGEALRTISDRDLEKSMDGILWDCNAQVRDEAPAAYKDSRKVMRGQRDLVKIRQELTPILSVKGW